MKKSKFSEEQIVFALRQAVGWRDLSEDGHFGSDVLQLEEVRQSECRPFGNSVLQENRIFDSQVTAFSEAVYGQYIWHGNCSPEIGGEKELSLSTRFASNCSSLDKCK